MEHLQDGLDLKSAPPKCHSLGDAHLCYCTLRLQSHSKAQSSRFQMLIQSWSVQVPNGETESIKVGLTWSQGHLNIESDGEQMKPSSSEASNRRQSQPRAPDQKLQQNGTLEDKPEHMRWKGKDVSFMRSNQHSKDRQGVWDSSGLKGAALTIVEGDEKGAKYRSCWAELIWSASLSCAHHSSCLKLQAF